ncbi:MAG TPA: CidA/LrgA family protein [Microvirga sp.]|jgi:holin-like protein|nr:CidA/LrgA family protein [Microvirga sp.]
MILSLTLILLCQLVGEVVALSTGWPVPGPVIGMVLLALLLLLRDRVRAAPPALRDGTLEGTAKGLLAHLSLLFVPAGVGVLQRLDVIAAHGLGLAVAILASTLLALLATAGTFLLASRLLKPDGRDAESDP